jgi:hypothetical protein
MNWEPKIANAAARGADEDQAVGVSAGSVAQEVNSARVGDHGHHHQQKQRVPQNDDSGTFSRAKKYAPAKRR